ncbi:response regulator [Parasalinivibrio latis]|uniref:response regulator n=1 Tax=Parasalinivibrio latis TaxID=2952610 RepID=UPI0030E04FA8
MNLDINPISTDAPLIAVVDDSDVLCDMLCELLQDEGFRARGYLSGQEALDGVKTEKPELILLDIEMPGMDGFEVCRKLKANPESADIPVLVISSYSEIDDKLKAFECGAVDYVTKPIQLSEVNARIRTHLALRHTQQELAEKNRALTATLDELKDTQQQLVQSEKMASLGQLVAGVAHEINNPVSFIVGNTHILQRNLQRIGEYLDMVHSDPNAPETSEKRRSLRIDSIVGDLLPLVGDIEEASQRVGAIVEDLRTFSARQESEKIMVDLADVAGLAVRWVSKSRPEDGTISLSIPEGLMVQGHSGQLTQVLVNLLNNALDAAAESGQPEVRVEGGTEGEKTWLSVTDNGPGIPDDRIHQIFDPFYTTKKVGEGTGLGLSISYGLVAEHGGTLEAENLAGGGARFVVSLGQQ